MKASLPNGSQRRLLALVGIWKELGVKKPTKVGKHRFVIDVDDAPRELFSVEERTGGDLGLYLKTGKEFADLSTGKHEELVEQRFSVHVSPRSSGHTIKQTIRTAAGVTTTSAFVLPKRTTALRPSGLIMPPAREFRWPMFAIRASNLRAERYISQPKARDKLASLGAYDPDKAQLVYLVVATSTNVATIATVRGRTSISTLLFSHFNLHVVYGFTLMPSLPEAEFMTFVTSQAQTGNRVSGRAGRPASAHSELMIEGDYFRALAHFRDKNAARYHDAFEEEGDRDIEENSRLVFVLSGVSLPMPPPDAESRRAALDAYLDEIGDRNLKGRIQAMRGELTSRLAILRSPTAKSG